MTVRARTRERRNTRRVEATKQSTELERAARPGPPPALNICTVRDFMEKFNVIHSDFHENEALQKFRAQLTGSLNSQKCVNVI